MARDDLHAIVGVGEVGDAEAAVGLDLGPVLAPPELEPHGCAADAAARRIEAGRVELADERVERLEVFWPVTGETQVFTTLAADQRVRIVEGEREPLLTPTRPIPFRR